LLSKFVAELYQYDIRFTIEGKEDEDFYAPLRYLDLRKKLYEELLKREERGLFKDTVRTGDYSMVLRGFRSINAW